MSISDACIITNAISGAVANKNQHPAIPYTPEEYAAQAREAYDAGASVVHIHARRLDGTPSVAVEDYRVITAAIVAEVPDIVINYSTGTIGIPMAERVGHVVQLKPELGALNMGSMNYAKWSSSRRAWVFDFVFENSFKDITFLLERMNEVGVKPECECFDVGHVESVYPLIEAGLLTTPIQFSFILGVVGGISAHPSNLGHMASRAPEGSTWEVIGISTEQWGLISQAAELGGNVRTGLEDNFTLPDGTKASGNGELVAKAAELVQAAGRKVASPAEARALLSLPDPVRVPALSSV
ncbi:MAG TPA: 3-keto-5-aminohexanoate cleavage protein [Mycobacteriales bacterium]|nr:3-keto-5-aminohexanoate cleavage protein [Mycobacteriales bacterium]